MTVQPATRRFPRKAIVVGSAAVAIVVAFVAYLAVPRRGVDLLR
jgi:hypothetical protein